ncbi:FecR family protein [Gracilimonas tropica]|uniref:FecR family protein n=1 Tax=Gracilimonas tropica TaxID=454600 RepID=UPI000364E968|nr:FecR domain-containing protein [Gracilimonas tropica]
MANTQSELDQLLQDDSFLRWIEGSASAKEQQRWELWVQKNEQRQELAESLRLIVKDLKFRKVKRPELGAELKRLNTSIEKDSRRLLYLGKLSKSDFWGAFTKVAAVFLVLVMSFLVYRTVDLESLNDQASQTVVNEFTVTSTENGEKKILSLSDGSKITLNANSQLTYPTKSAGSNIEVTLRGEAYFDITNNPEGQERTFTVNVPNGKVTVLGTQFNVNAYDSDTEVYLKEGKVRLALVSESEEVIDEYLMNPGEMSRFSVKGTSIKTKAVEPEIYTSWIDNKLVFQQAPLSDVAERLGHIYKVDFRIEESDYDKIIVTGSLPNNNLSVFVNALQKLLDRPITVKDSTVYLGNSINK